MNIQEVVQGFRSFGYVEEAGQIEGFLKAIGNEDCKTFTPV